MQALVITYNGKKQKPVDKEQIAKAATSNVASIAMPQPSPEMGHEKVKNNTIYYIVSSNSGRLSPPHPLDTHFVLQ